MPPVSDAGGEGPGAAVPSIEGSADRVVALVAPVDGVCAAIHATAGQHVRAGEPVLTIESMKTEFLVRAETPSDVVVLHVDLGEQLVAGQVVASVRPVDGAHGAPDAPTEPEPRGLERPDLAEVQRRRALLTDAHRPEAVRRRQDRGRRTARTNVEDLLDAGSLNEYGGFAIASQRSRRPLQELIERTPADGLICATGTVGAAALGPDRARVAVMAYDASVLAGTQGFQNHRKTDRLLDLALRHRLPTVVLAEGGGGRPGDVDAPGATALDVPTFARFAAVAGEVPTVALVSGYCFAGNAALAGCCDLIVATEDSNLGMAGPAMIEGAGLPPVEPTAIGPIGDQWANGVVDVRVADEIVGVTAVRRLLSHAQGPSRVAEGVEAADQQVLRDLVPMARRRAYDVRAAIEAIVDRGSFIELRGGWAPGMVTALAHLGGRPVGILANDPTHLGGAIDLEAARSAARMMELCRRWGLPVVSFCDTPGFMVGVEEEARGQVREFGDMFLAAARAAAVVPWVLVVLRKCYGLGAQAMAGGSLHVPVLGLSWPTGEFGGMGLEGAVRLGFRRELEAIEDPVERAELEADLIERAYAHGSALNVATHFEIDDVIDPAHTRERVQAALLAACG
jgi:acetyl-CoA carboxylase carboxyltransferase component